MGIVSGSGAQKVVKYMLFPFRLIDLTHPLSPNVPSWHGSCGFRHEVKLDYDQCTTEVKFRVQQIKMHAGIGTHMDAPAHIIPGGATVDEMDIQNFLAPCIVVDVSARAHERYCVTCQDIHAFEHQYGQIPHGGFVIIHTGWQTRWQTPELYRNKHVFPSVSGQAAHLLVERGVVGLGIDTLSPDRPEDGFPTHQALLGAGKYIVENVACAQLLPPTGSFSLALPIKTVGGTEAPIRLVGLV